MKVIGLSGRACAGKNQFAKEFESNGCIVIDVDLLGHAALEKSVGAIRETFGDTVISQGKVDRKALGRLVFSDSLLLAELESITHPIMVSMCKDSIEAAKGKGVKALVINAALLHRMGLDGLCDEILFIQVPLLVRFFRARKRDHQTWKRFMAREKAQQDICFDKFAKGIPVRKMSNIGPSLFIHRQVTLYCGTIGIEVS